MIERSLSLLSHNDNVRLLSMRNLYHSRLDYLLNNQWRIEPQCHSLIEFSISEKNEKAIYSSILNIGALDSNEISADKCLISRDEDVPIFKDDEFSFEIVSYSKEGKEMKKGGNGKRFKIQIEGEVKNVRNEKNKNHEWEIKDLKNGKYEVKMKIKNEGKHSIFVQYNGVDLPFSPFQIQVFLMKSRNFAELNGPKLTFCSKGNEVGQLSNPYGITTDSKGNILVCDTDNHRVQIFSPKGNFISLFGSNGNGNGQFNFPYGITINSKGNILVSDFKNHRIQIFDSKGVFISTFGSKGNENGQFFNPYGICVDKNDNVYVCDHYNDRIQIFGPTGEFITNFGSPGNRDGLFSNPCGIAINSKGNIIVSDFRNYRIQIFSLEGKFISSLGSQGNGIGQFSSPYGLCIDSNDNILVCDHNSNRIQIFEFQNGFHVTQFPVNQPTSIRIDPKTQDIIVCGLGNTISIY